MPKKPVKTEAPEDSKTETSSDEAPGLGTIALTIFQGFLENNAEAAIDYGGSAAVVGAKKLGWTFDEFAEHMRLFWDKDEERKF